MDHDILDIVNNLELLKQAQGNLLRIQTEYNDDPELLSIYEPSAKQVVLSLQESINHSLMEKYSLNSMHMPDIWIKLKGKAFDKGRAPLGVVGAFLQKLVVANQHAVALLEQVKYDGGRFKNRIKELAEFDLVATAPGSLMLGLKKPEYGKFLDIEIDKQIDGQMFDEQVYIESVHRAEDESHKAIEGIQLLSRAMIAAENEEEFKLLSEEVKNSKNMLKLLHYAREITPSQTSPIEEIDFLGNIKINDKYESVRISKETRVKLKERSNKLIENEKYAEGMGIVREIDLDRLTFRVADFRMGYEIFPNIDCKLSDGELTEEDVKDILDKLVFLSGILVMTTKGKVKCLEVDRIKILDEVEKD